MIPTFVKELRVLWTTPVPYLAAVVFHVAFGLFSVDTLQARQQAGVQPLVPIAGFLILVAVPLLTMRTVAEERRSGGLDVLLAIPVRPAALIVGKWAAVLVSVTVILVPIALTVALLEWWGDPDTGPVVTGAIGLVLLAAAAAAIGVAASAATSSQAAAGITGLFVVLAGWFVRPSPTSVTFRGAAARLSVNERLRSFASGGLDGADVGFFVAVVAVALLCATAALVARSGAAARRRAAVVVGGIAVAVALVQWNLDDRTTLVDLTAGNSLTLTATTTDLLHQLDREVAITAFVRGDDPTRSETAALLDRYEAESDRIGARLVDPAERPGEARRLGVDALTGGTVLESGGESVRVPGAIEQDLTIGIARLIRGALPEVCLTSGHGELDPESRLPTGGADAAGVLAANGYPVRTVDLLAGDRLTDCGVVVVMAPVTDLGRGATDLAALLTAGGRVALFVEPGFPAGLEPVLGWGHVRSLPGVVVEADPSSAYSGDPAAPLVRRYSSASPVVRNLAPTFFVTVGGLTVADPVPGGAVVSRLADTSADSLLVVDGDGGTAATPGPITVATATESVAVEGPGVVRGRLVVVADGDVVSNAFLGQAANRTLWLQIVDWLSVDEDLVRLQPNLPEVRPLELTAARRDYARLLSTVLVPGAFVLVGGFVWVLRRGR